MDSRTTLPEPWAWDLADVQRLVNERIQESLVLDYKGSDALAKDSDSIRELCKDVSAFANSQGGTLLYGVAEDQQRYPLAIDGGSDPAAVSAEWLGQIIDSRISPRIRGYRIRSIPLATGRVLYVIHVPQSETAHMANDSNRYYRRSDCRSVPMEDYEVRDVMRRSEAADVHLEFRLASGATKLFVRAENFAPVPAPYFVAYLYLGQGSGASHPNLRSTGQCEAILRERVVVTCDAFQVNYLADVPLMQGIIVDILEGTAITLANWPAYQFFAWETIAPGRVNRRGYHGTHQNTGQPLPLAPEWWSVGRPRPRP